MRQVVVSGARSYARSKEELKKLAGKLMRLTRQNSSVLEVIFLSDTGMQSLRKRHFPSGRHLLSRETKQKRADVISFPEPETREFVAPRRFLGEIYLNGDICKENPDELGRLFVHGFLHLLGYAHGKRDDALKMERLEAFLGDRIGKRDPFCRNRKL